MFFHSSQKDVKAKSILKAKFGKPIEVTNAHIQCVHRVIIRPGITCKEISCFMRNSACRRLIIENVEQFLIFPRERDYRILIFLCE